MAEGLREGLAELLGKEPAELQTIAGGDICRAFRVRLADGSLCFAKTPASPCPGLLECEAAGLRWLGETGALRVPEVVACRDAVGQEPALLVLEWIEAGPPGRDFDRRLGEGLAALHAAGAPGFGYERDNWIGRLPQANGPRETWPRFYAEQRLAPQIRRARNAGHLSGRLLERAERIVGRLDTLAGPAESPARLHGDLWGGNVMADAEGEPVLIDPAAYGGHREVDLAMMRLFGGFAAECFEAYEAAAPLAAGHEARVSLWQLYPLLVHLNLFGPTYRGPFARALAACER